MAKGLGLGKGVSALMGEASIDVNSVLNGAPAQTAGIPVDTTKTNNNIPDCVEVDENGGLWLDPTLLKPNPKQPRKEFNEKKLEELANSIKAKGILQPIIVEYIKDKEFYIIAGERRTRAAKMAGLSKVPVQLRKFDEQQKLEFALIENIQRADLNPIEEAMAYYNLIQMGDLSQDEVAKQVGKNRTTVANSIRLLKLPTDIQKALSEGEISAGHARALLMVKNDSDMRILYGRIIGSGLSVREAEAMAEAFNNGGRATDKNKDKNKDNKKTKDPDFANFEQELRNIFGVKGVNLKGSMEKGSLEISFTSRDDFDRIYEVLMRK